MSRTWPPARRGLIALAAAIMLTGAPPLAHGQSSRTYFGTNGPPGERPSRPSGPTESGDRFVANTYGDAIEVVSQGGDQCGRPFYIQGVITFATNTNTGTIGGPMLRCTTEKLKADCLKVGVRLTDYYEVGYSGTVERNPETGSLVIEITYPYAIWVSQDCKQKREEQGSETLMLFYEPPTPPEPGLNDQVTRIRRRAIDGTVDQFVGGKLFQH